ncbi:MAG: gliding motility-associated C-terminal domain-containing protein [Crocinitomicaceae bacterium]|nr:gliding motility-associated C-terminal domain-containing protein [Crocinitomicaceae bacterium]
MKSLRTYLSLAAVFTLFNLFGQNLIINGDMEAGPGGTGVVPTGWTIVQHSPDNCASPPSACPGPSYVINNPSPDGGRWERFFRGGGWNERFGQYICVPLVAGQSYTLEFWASYSKLNSSTSATTTGIQYGFSTGLPGGTGAGTGNAGSVNMTSPEVWQLVSVTFVAAANYDFISFAKSTTETNNAAYIDGVSLIGTNPPSGGNPGTNGTISVCPSDPVFNLFDQLGGTPDVGGTWTGPSVVSGGYLGTFTPGTNASGVYTYEVVGSGPCTSSTPATATVTVTAGSADATITAAGPFCDNGAAVTLSAVDPGGTWSGTGITNATTGTFDPSVSGPGTFTITYSITGACSDTDTENITVNASADATITAVGPFCETAAAITLAGADPGGTWSGTGITNSSAGTFDPGTAGPGTHTITYTIGGACGDVQTTNITINALANATITPAGPYCDTDPAVNLSAVDAGGTWSGTGITNSGSGTFDPLVAGVGTHTITYTIAGSCGDVQNTTITVNSVSNATITPVGPFCDSDPPITLSAVDPGGTWSGTGVTNAATGTFDPGTAGPGTHTVTYTIGGACGDVQTTNIVVNGMANATITPAGPFCDNDPSVNLTAVDAGGTWSGTGIINVATGTFDPATAGSGTHTITYTIGGSCGDVQTTNITVNNVANATITAVGPFCDADPSVNLSAVDAGGTWSGTGITNAATGTFDPSTAGPGTHTITYTIAGMCGDVQTTDIIVNQVMDATITPVGPFCDSDPLITLNAVDAGGTWSGTGIINASTGDFDPATAGGGTHTITYTIAGACGDVQTTDITVIPLADATISAAGPFCDMDAPINLMSVDAGGSWAGTGITDANFGTFDPSVAGVGTHTITYTIAGQCGAADTEDIIVNATDDPSINPAGPFCQSSHVEFITAVTAGGTWSGTGITNASTGEFTPSVAGEGIYTISYTTAGVCPATGTVNIEVLPALSVVVSQDVSICEGESTTLTAQGTGGDGNLTITWTDDQNNNVGTGTSIQVSPIVTTIYTATITDGCNSLSASDQLTVTVIPLPVINFTALDFEGCVPFTADFIDSTVPTGTNCSWDFGDGISSSTCGNVSHVYGSPGCYDVTYTVSQNNCTSTITIPSMICVFEYAEADFTANPDEVDVENTIVDLENESINATSYEWTFEDGSISTVENPLHQFPEVIGHYTVCLKAMNDGMCNDSICKVVVVTEQLIFYIPNTFTPDGDQFNERFQPQFTSGFDIYDFHLTIFNRWGEIIFESFDASVGWNGHYGDGGLVEDGTYIWQVDFKSNQSDERYVQRGHVTVLK